MYISNWLWNLNGGDIRDHGELTQGDEICGGGKTKAAAVLSDTAVVAAATTAAMEAPAVAVAAARVWFVVLLSSLNEHPDRHIDNLTLPPVTPATAPNKS